MDHLFLLIKDTMTMKFNPSFGWHFIFWKKTEKGNCFFILGFNSPWSYVFRFDEIGWKQNKKYWIPFLILKTNHFPSYLSLIEKKRERENEAFFFFMTTFYQTFAECCNCNLGSLSLPDIVSPSFSHTNITN